MAQAKTVLVVDDDRDLLELIDTVLVREGYQVATATSGQDALESMSLGLPDLILLDMKMPLMDGFEFARQFSAQYNQVVPIVVFTAADGAKESAEELGAVGWISKPFELDVLLAVVARHVGGGGAD